jgi:hypothetical protein
MFPIVETAKEILDALETNRGCFIKHPDYVADGEQAFHDSNRVFDAKNLKPLDEKTMFPTKIASLVGVERQVIQQYVNIISTVEATQDVDLMQDIREMIWSSNIIVGDIFWAAHNRYGWDIDTYENVAFETSEWTLNIARYPFVDNKKGEILFPAHKDWGLLAIYPFVHGAGLEVFVPEVANEWQALIIPKDCAFCYAGDIFARITDNKIKPLTHRVVQPTDQVGSRTSIIFYVDPPRSMVLPSREKVGDIIDSKLKKIGQIT